MLLCRQSVLVQFSHDGRLAHLQHAGDGSRRPVIVERLTEDLLLCFFYYLQEYAPNDSEKLRESVIRNYADDVEDAMEYFANNGEDNPSEDDIWSYYSEMVDDMDSEDKVIEVLGYDAELLSFLSDNQIDDLHFGNYGESERGWIIIDFCGYEAAYTSFRATHPNLDRTIVE